MITLEVSGIVTPPPPFFFSSEVEGAKSLCLQPYSAARTCLALSQRQGCRELYCFQVAKIFHDIHPQKDCRAHPKAPKSSSKDGRAKFLAVSGKSGRSHNLQPGKFRLNVGKKCITRWRCSHQSRLEGATSLHPGVFSAQLDKALAQHI